MSLPDMELLKRRIRESQKQKTVNSDLPAPPTTTEVLPSNTNENPPLSHPSNGKSDQNNSNTQNQKIELEKQEKNGEDNQNTFNEEQQMASVQRNMSPSVDRREVQISLEEFPNENFDHFVQDHTKSEEHPIDFNGREENLVSGQVHYNPIEHSKSLNEEHVMHIEENDNNSVKSLNDKSLDQFSMENDNDLAKDNELIIGKDQKNDEASVKSLTSRTSKQSEHQLPKQIDEQLENLELAKKPQPEYLMIEPPKAKLFKVKTKTTYDHDCSKLGLVCPDFSSLQTLFELLSQTSMKNEKRYFDSLTSLLEHTSAMVQILNRLTSVEQYRQLYFEELFYILKNILAFTSYQINETFACLCSALIQSAHINPAFCNAILELVDQSSYFYEENRISANPLVIDKALWMNTVVRSYLEENNTSHSQSKLYLISDLMMYDANVHALFEHLSSLPNIDIISNKVTNIIEKVSRKPIVSNFDHSLLHHLIRLSLVPKSQQRFKVVEIILDYLQDADSESIINDPDFQDLASFLFLNKVYNSSNKEDSTENSIKEIWHIVGKSYIKDSLIDHQEECLNKYIQLYYGSLDLIKDDRLPTINVSMVEIYDFQLSLLIAIMELCRTSLNEEYMGQTIQTVLSFIDTVLSNTNPRIEANRLLRFINFIIDDFIKRDNGKTAPALFARLPHIIRNHSSAFLQVDSINLFEKTIAYLYDPKFDEVLSKTNLIDISRTLPADQANTLAVLIYENVEENEDPSSEIEDQILKIGESLLDIQTLNSVFFAKIKKLENCQKFKNLVAYIIKANLEEIATSLESHTDKMISLLVWCRDDLLQAIDDEDGNEKSEIELATTQKIKTILTNFNQC